MSGAVVRAPALAVAALALFACAGAKPAAIPKPAAEPRLPSVALPPELERVLRDYEAGWRGGDAAALAELFAEDGLVLQAHRPPVRGRDAIRAAYGTPGGDLRLRAFAFASDGAVGWIVGAYGYGEGAAERDLGKFTLALRRGAAGRWLIASDMDNASAPERGAAADG